MRARFLHEEQRQAHISALGRELDEYVRRGMHDRALQVIEQIELAGGKVADEVKMTAAAALKLSQRRRTAAGPPHGAQTRSDDAE